ncbi:MAG TPA: flagellar export chaperone FliS [Oligoflexia bacterium]|nr:flagellar export chaperone FliS [Oligoflexia bacterium]HMP47640.1 flagellar export chaperone FliS [Oligoflexia bacterium]
MYSKLAHQQYTSVHVTTIDKGRLLLMLFDGCMKFLKHAKVGLETNDIPKFAKFLSKSQAIISELMITLDFEKGGDIARELDRLYDFMLYYLTEANLEKSPDKVQKVIDLLETIAMAYREVIEGESKSPAKEDSTIEQTKSEFPQLKQGALNISL